MKFGGFISAVLALASFATAHNEIIPPRGKVCYFENIKTQDRFNIDFQVGTRDPTSSEQLEVDFYVLSPSGQKVYELLKVPDGKVDVPLSTNGRYEFCFSNEHSSTSSKDITFHVDHVWGSELRSEQYNSLDGQLKLLERIVSDLSHESEYLRIRERTHRNTAESTNERVKWWSLAQLVFVIVNAVFQVAYLKRFFEVKSNV